MKEIQAILTEACEKIKAITDLKVNYLVTDKSFELEILDEVDWPVFNTVNPESFNNTEDWMSTKLALPEVGRLCMFDNYSVKVEEDEEGKLFRSYDYNVCLGFLVKIGCKYVFIKETGERLTDVRHWYYYKYKTI